MIFSYEHGCTRTLPGIPPLLRLTLDDGGQLALAQVDAPGAERPLGATRLTLSQVETIVRLLDPQQLPRLGAEVGHGPSWGILTVAAALPCTLTVRWSSSAGSLLAGAWRDLPPALEGRMFALTRMIQALQQPPPLPASWWSELGIALPADHRVRPVMEGPRGRLLLRFCMYSASSPPETTGRWFNLYDSGYVELRRQASYGDDGKPAGTSAELGPERARALVALIDGLGLRRGYGGDEHTVCYERYRHGKVEEGGFGWDSEMGALLTSAPLNVDQINAVANAFRAVFEALR